MPDDILSTLSSELIEASNGTIMALLVFVIGGFAVYIAEHWWMSRCRGEPIWARRPLITVYHERKAAIALLWGFSGFEVRTFAVWWPRHVANDGGRLLDVIPVWLPSFLLILGTIMALVGCACWLRVTIPIRIARWSFRFRGRVYPAGHLIWFVIAVGCAVWGSWMAWY